jgi:hypothetical protein
MELGLVEPQDCLMDCLGVPAIDGQGVRRLLNGKCAAPPKDPLVVIVEDIQDAIIGIPEQHLQRDPPVLQEVLTFVHDDGIIAEVKLLQGTHQSLWQKKVVVTVLFLSVRQYAGPLGKVCAQAMKMHNVQILFSFQA